MASATASSMGSRMASDTTSSMAFTLSFDRSPLHHGETTKTFDFSSDCAKMAANTIFYADCEHELQKITKGKRLSLAFNLVRRNVSFDMQLVELREFSSRLWKAEEALRLWREALTTTGARGDRVPRGRQNKLAIPLKNRYAKTLWSGVGIPVKPS